MDMRKSSVASLLICASLAAGQAGADVVIDNQNIPGADILAISVNPTSGDITINTKDGYTVEKNDGGTTPTSVAINGFTINPLTSLEGDTINISWSTTNAVSCAPSGGTASWRAKVLTVPTGFTTITADVTGAFVFTMVCNGSTTGDTTSRSQNVSIQPKTTTPTSCPTQPLSGSVVTWNQFWQVGFPMPVYTNKFFSVPRTGYQAIKFETGSIVDNGKFTTIETTTTDGVRFGTVTECPGDFSAAVPKSCRYVWGLGGGLSWATDGKAGACQLEPNSTYYFNLTYTDGTNPSSTTCHQSPCVTELQHINF